MCVVGFEVLTAVSMKKDVFWVVALCSLVEVYQRFRGSCCLHHQGNSGHSCKNIRLGLTSLKKQAVFVGVTPDYHTYIL
jgi:hypothetical protein